MPKVLIKGFETKEQAEAFVAWYSDQGEQDLGNWLGYEVAIDVSYMNCNDSKTKWVDNTLEMTVKPE